MEREKNSLKEFVEKIRKNVNAKIYEKEEGFLLLWINGFEIELDPQFDNGEFLCTTMTIKQYQFGKKIAEIFISSDKIIYTEYGNGYYEQWTYETNSPFIQDPVFLVNELELFDFLNYQIKDLDLKELFKELSGLE